MSINQNSLGTTPRHEIFSSGKRSGESLRDFTDDSMKRRVAYSIAISNATAITLGDELAEAYTQGQWHGFNFTETTLNAVKNWTEDSIHE